MLLKRGLTASLILSSVTLMIPTSAVADEMMGGTSGHRLEFGPFYLRGSLSSESFQNGPSRPITNSITGFQQGNIENSIFGLNVKYGYIFSGIPIGIHTGVSFVVSQSTTQTNFNPITKTTTTDDVRALNDSFALVIPIQVSYNFRAGNNLEPYIYFVNYITAQTTTPKDTRLPSNGGFYALSPGGGAGLRYFFGPNWGLDFNVEYASLNFNTTFTANAFTQAASASTTKQVAGTQYSRIRNGGFFSVNLGLAARF